MEGTFSVNIGKSTQATNYPLKDYLSLTGPMSQEDILYPLRDNVDKLVFPEAIRNSFLSLWTSIPFKPVSVGTYSYIGVDTLNPADNDLEMKVLIGKRSFSGTYSYSNSHDIMTSNLLSKTASDIYFFNTKKDTVANTSTKISILSGTGSYKNSPYIQSDRVSGVTQSLSLDFISNNGDVNIGNIVPDPNNRDYSPTGSLVVNEIKMPTVLDNYNSVGSDRLWFCDGVDNGIVKLKWDELRFPETDNIGATGSEIDLYGDVRVNGYSLELSDDRYTSMDIGGIVKGTSFDNMAISEVLRSMIYSYLPPLCSITIDNKYAEVGTYPEPILNYSITKRTKPTTTSLHNMIPGFHDPITNNEQVTETGTSTGIVISPIGATQTIFTIIVNDGSVSQSASTSIEGIYPYFYGFSDLNVITNSELRKLTKLVEYKSDKTVDISGKGNYYFIYDKNYGPISSIKDEYNNEYIDDFTYSIRKLSNGPWALKEFYVYQMNNVLQIGPPSVNYYFKL